MSEHFGAVGASFEVIETRSGKPVFIELGTGIQNVPKQEYLEYFGPISPRVNFSIDKPSGFISHDYMFLSDAEMERDEFYSDCIRPMGLRYFVAAQIFASENHQAVFAAQRSPAQGAVGTAEIALMKRLMPHLQQVTDLRFRLAAQRAEERIGFACLERLSEGCLTIDRSGKATHLNRMAEHIVAQADGIGLVNGRLTFAETEAHRRYRRAIGQVAQTDRNAISAPPRDFLAQRPGGGRPYLVSVRPLAQDNPLSFVASPSVAMVFLRDPTLFARLDRELLKQSYHLTERELDLATALDRGQTVQEIARDREISLATARGHLYTIMAKLDVRRQADLVRLLAQYRQPFT